MARRVLKRCGHAGWIALGTALTGAAMAGEPRTPPLAEVRAGIFEVIVTEQAELAARQSVTIASELPSNAAKIAWVVGDGAWLAAGDLVARFDAEPFRDEAEKAQRDYDDAHASLLQAEAEMQILIRRGVEQDEALGHQIELARLKLEQFRKADRVLRLARARAESVGARTALERARLEADTQRRLVQEGLSSAALLAQAEADEVEKRGTVATLEQTAKLLDEVVLPSEEREAELELARKERERTAAQQAQQYSLGKQQAAIFGVQSRVAAYASALERANARLGHVEIRAPVAGFAVHVPVSVGTAYRKVQVGDSVWERHGFVVIPDMSALLAEVRVREIDLGKIETGQTVTLHPEAFPDLTLGGRVESVGTLAERTSADDGNEFAVRIAVDSIDPRLRPGMRARAEILARRFEDAIHVPVEAVFRDRGEWVAFVWDGGRAERRVITTAESDGADIVVVDGLRKGERVLLAYPGASAE